MDTTAGTGKPPLGHLTGGEPILPANIAANADTTPRAAEAMDTTGISIIAIIATHES
ncbi:MAG: hypothetical protein ACP5XB_10775 [Isosphaeraceae bacterium]